MSHKFSPIVHVTLAGDKGASAVAAGAARAKLQGIARRLVGRLNLSPALLMCCIGVI